MLPILFLPQAEKYFKKLNDKQLKRKFQDALIKIRMEPEVGEIKTGDLSGILGYDIYHQGTNYEIAYRIATNDNGDVVVVIMAGTRENFWDTVKRYIR
jgi:mRNA interferase RelE/StbE